MTSPRCLHRRIKAQSENASRARVSDRAVRTVLTQRCENLTLNLALSACNGVEIHSFNIGGTTDAKFEDLFAALEEMIGMKYFFILDNAPCHKTKRHTTTSSAALRLTPNENTLSAWNRLTDPAVQAEFSNREAARQDGMNASQFFLEFGETAISVVTV